MIRNYVIPILLPKVVFIFCIIHNSASLHRVEAPFPNFLHDESISRGTEELADESLGSAIRSVVIKNFRGRVSPCVPRIRLSSRPGRVRGWTGRKARFA